MLGQAKVRDGSGQPIQSAGGPTLAAQGPKDAVQDRVTGELVEGFTQGVFLQTKGTPQAADIEPTLRAMGNQIVDTALDNPERSPAVQAELVKEVGAVLSAERADRLAGELYMFETVASAVREELAAGDPSEKLAALQRLNSISQALSPDAQQYGSPVTSPEAGQLGAALRSSVPDVTPLVSAQQAMDAMGPPLDTPEAWVPNTQAERSDLADKLREVAAPLKEGGPRQEQVAAQLQGLADEVEKWDLAASKAAHASTQQSLDSAIESTARDVAAAFNGPVGERVSASAQSLAASAQAAAKEGLLYTGETAGAWSALAQSDPSWGQMAEPLRALADTRDAGTLRALLGEAAKDFSDADLTKAVSPQDVSKAKEMGLTGQQVQDAVSELKAAASEEGRPLSSVDTAVALEALVGQERALEEMQREDPQFAKESREAGQEKSFFDQGRQQDDGAKHEEREAELELDGGD
jgi:hypothetical protein